MATYAIGDIQGCFLAFERLLSKIRFAPGSDHLWLVGDLVNRGPQSLEVLRRVHRLRDSMTVVLGNHDLHLLASAWGARETKSKDSLDDILTAPDRDKLLEWLCHCPFVVGTEHYVMVHAGLLPSWTVEKALDLSRELESALQSPQRKLVLDAMYAGTDPEWKDSLEPPDRWTALANAFTRLRVCGYDGRPRFDFSGPLKALPPGRVPWFAFPGRQSATHTVVCGHWAALGLHLEPNVLALDSGCVWGGALTALRLEDRQLFQVSCT